MASPQGHSKYLDNVKIDTYAVDQDLSTDAVPSAFATWIDMKDYTNVTFVVTGINLTGVGPDGLSILADSDSDGGSGTNVTIVTHAVTSAPASEGDSLVIECSTEQLAQEGADNSVNLRYVAPKIGLANALDECVVTVIRSGAKFPRLNLTADSLVY